MTARSDMAHTPDWKDETAFVQYDQDNPHIWDLFVQFTQDRIAAGFTHYGARDVIHRIRWETEAIENGKSGLKINNIWSPWYARKYHQAYPQHRGFFRCRAALADSHHAESPVQSRSAPQAKEWDAPTRP